MQMRPFRRAGYLSVALWVVATSVAVAGPPRYMVVPDERLERLDVRICFDGTVPRRLTARNERAPDLLRTARLETRDDFIELKPQGTTLMLPRVPAPSCLQYHVDLTAIPARNWRSSSILRVGEAVILEPALWLWYPDSVRQDEPWRLEFTLPPGHDVSGPWSRIGRSGETVRYEIRERLAGWDARMAIGRFSVESIDLPGGRIRYALLPGEPAPDAGELRRWVTSGARAMLTAYGLFPVTDLQLLVVPIGRGRDPVPWAEVQRGDGDAVHLYIDQRRPAEEFMADWVLVHELSHLLHPIIAARDRGLSEGIESYYQKDFRARAGLLSPAKAWTSLHAVFERGLRGTPPGRSLAEVSESMMRDRSFMRVYWSGAAIALLADVELRRQSGGSQSLDTALAGFRDCCLPAGRSWSAREFMGQLDRLTGTTVFTELYRAHVDSHDFPDLGALYDELGLRPMSATSLRIDPDAPGAAICAAIMTADED